MKLYIAFIIAFFLAACETQQHVEKQKPAEQTVIVQPQPQTPVVEEPIPQPTVKPYTPRPPNILPPLRTDGDTTPPPGCVELRLRGGTC